jgi:hypothetical protein
MMKMEDRLGAIAHMMDASPDYSSTEKVVWRELVRHVDRACFERTGRIIASGLTPEGIARNASRGAPPLTPSCVGEALARLTERGHLVVDMGGPKHPPCYRLFLFNRPVFHV